ALGGAQAGRGGQGARPGFFRLATDEVSAFSRRLGDGLLGRRLGRVTQVLEGSLHGALVTGILVVGCLVRRNRSGSGLGFVPFEEVGSVEIKGGDREGQGKEDQEVPHRQFLWGNGAAGSGKRDMTVPMVWAGILYFILKYNSIFYCNFMIFHRN